MIQQSHSQGYPRDEIIIWTFKNINKPTEILNNQESILLI